jgi:hypothetical protein
MNCVECGLFYNVSTNISFAIFRVIVIASVMDMECIKWLRHSRMYSAYVRYVLSLFGVGVKYKTQFEWDIVV